MAEKGMATRRGATPATQDNMRTAEYYLTPFVDIFETNDNLTFLADMPGVEKDGLEINLEKGFLTLTGKVRPTSKGTLLYHEFSATSYYRQFKLPDHLDMEKTSAEFDNGVLTLTILKAEAAKPHRIEIKH